MVDLLVHYSVIDPDDASEKYIFAPNLAGPGGLTPLHLAASATSSEDLIDALISDPMEVTPFRFHPSMVKKPKLQIGFLTFLSICFHTDWAAELEFCVGCERIISTCIRPDEEQSFIQRPCGAQGCRNKNRGGVCGDRKGEEAIGSRGEEREMLQMCSCRVSTTEQTI